MTICIAAIGKEQDEEFIVFSTDHMITTQMGQFEHSILKYKPLNGHTVAMLAGNPFIFEELVELKDNNVDFETIKNEIFDNFKKKRQQIIQNGIFNMYGIDQEFFIESLKREVPNEYIDTILTQVTNLKLDTRILLVGMDNGIAKIVEIDEEDMTNFRDMNFHAIGSGDTQAVNTLLFQKHDKCDNLLATLYNVYKAKRNAEVLRGVGKETELLILGKETYLKINGKNMSILRKIYEDELMFGKENKELLKIDLKEG